MTPKPVRRCDRRAVHMRRRPVLHQLAEPEMSQQYFLVRDRLGQREAFDRARTRQRDPPVVDDLALLHHDDPIGEQHRLVDVVGDEQHRRPMLAPQRQQQLMQLQFRHIVERAEGLIHEEHPRRVCENRGDRHPLQHAAGEFARPGALDVGQAPPL